MIIQVDKHLSIELIHENHAEPIFDMVANHRAHLRKWLDFVDRMQSIDFAEKYVYGTMQRNKEGHEYAFVILEDEAVVGRIGVYKIDHYNKMGEIGYWLIESKQGMGIITKCCTALIDFCFTELHLNRIEIKCGTENHKSSAIPEKLNFTKEGILRKAEWLHDQFIDLKLFSLLRSDRESV